MNVHSTDMMAPPVAMTLSETGLSLVMMRDILLKTMFRTNLELISDLERTLCLPARVVQELIDMCRDGGRVEAMGTLHAGSKSSEMG